MNQYLKNAVYEKGSRAQLAFLEEISGMTELECKMIEAWHEGGLTDEGVWLKLGLTQTSAKPVEDAIRAKLAIAVFHCIDYCMFFERPKN